MPLIRTALSNRFFEGFSVEPVQIVIDAGNNGVHGVRVEFSGDADTWEALQTRALFQYRDEICGPIFGGAFRIDLPFNFTVELVPEQVAVVAALASTPERAHEVLARAPVDSPLRDPANYRLLTVMQPRTPKTQWGMSTSYLRESGGG